MYITIKVKIIWYIKGYDDYGFGTDKSLYNIKRCRKLKQVSNNGTIGYVLNSKFMSLNKIKSFLYKPFINQLPF